MRSISEIKKEIDETDKSEDWEKGQCLFQEWGEIELKLIDWWRMLAPERQQEIYNAEKDGRLAILPYKIESSIGLRITERREGLYNYHSIHSACYVGDDCKMPHCNGCPIRTMYQVIQIIEDQQESVLQTE